MAKVALLDQTRAHFITVKMASEPHAIPIMADPSPYVHYNHMLDHSRLFYSLPFIYCLLAIALHYIASTTNNPSLMLFYATTFKVPEGQKPLKHKKPTKCFNPYICNNICLKIR